MNTFVSKIAKLNRLLQLHTNWLLYFVFGPTAISHSSFAALKTYKKLPLDSSLDLAKTSFILGKLKASTKKTEYANATLSDTEDLFTTEDVTAFDKLSLKSILSIAQFSAELTQMVAGVFSKLLLESKPLDPKVFDRLKVKFALVVKTELHRAKVAGSVNAIVSKQGVFSTSNGLNSNVIVVPGANCCLDCKRLYLNPDGSPKLFVLADLINARQSEEHEKKSGIHTHWIATLPPVHPNCGCMVRYVPPGYAWEAGKLSLVNKSLFDSTLNKATAGVAGGIASTVKPKGAPSQQKPPGMPSVAGVAAPGNTAGPGRPPALGTAAPKGGVSSTGGTGGNDMAACPFGGGSECEKHGGNGATQHKSNGSIMKKHQEAMAAGAIPQTEEAKEQQKKQEQVRAKTFFADKSQTTQVLAEHLSEGTISSAKKLGKEMEDGDDPQSGAHVSYKVTIAGNGSGCMKPPPTFPEEGYAGWLFADGLSSLPPDKGHISEVAAHQLSSSLGLDHVPVTVSREHDGLSDVHHVGPMSVQSWQEGWNTLESRKKPANSLNEVLSSVPDEHKERVQTKLAEIACLDIVMNNNDRHMGNLVFSPDQSDVKAIDHGLSFGSGMEGHKNIIHQLFVKSGKDLTVPDHMITRFKTQSFDQTKRQLESSGLTDWQVAQTHVRMKYLAHLQETHGSIPVESTRYAVTVAVSPDPVMAARTKGVLPTHRAPAFPGWERDADKRTAQIKKANDSWEMPDQLFARFAKDYSTGKIGDASTQEQAQLQGSIKLFPTGTAHFEGGSSADRTIHWDSIPSYSPLNSWGKDGVSHTEARAPTILSAIGEFDTVKPTRELDTVKPTRELDTVKPTRELDTVKPTRELDTVKPNRKLDKSLFLSDISSAFPVDIYKKE